MIPIEVADLCKIIDPSWPDMDEEEFQVVLGIAYAVHNAGYRKPTILPSA